MKTRKEREVCFQDHAIDRAVDDQQMTALHILCSNPHVTGDCIRAYLQLVPEAAEQQDSDGVGSEDFGETLNRHGETLNRHGETGNGPDAEDDHFPTTETKRSLSYADAARGTKRYVKIGRASCRERV